ncbi:exported protein of unknown function [Candidatus Nitrospira inopinata]|uniref:Uncharacterized protein n=1 Tax=Candidatus Nitrospira inopinata TaxID=1715989 RepID=A0A0S4KPZ3_9BACT|nr:exported protein of unknown function [Candidatus Nitrospira inopinata]
MVPEKQRTTFLIALSCIVSFAMGLAACGHGDELPDAADGGTPPPVGTSRLLFFDDFEYDVARSATDAELQFRAHGWTDVKAINSYFGRGNGYLYTRFDPVRNSRVLVMESYPSTAYSPPNFPHRQTDYWVKYGAEDAPLTTVPANVWFQFWTYATPESRFASSKFIYPCRGPYPCTTERFAWLFGWHNVTGPESNPTMAPVGGWFWSFRAPLANNRAEPEWNRDKLYQNLNPTPLLAGRWYQVRIHVDTSGAQGAYELWVRERGVSTWTKVSEWIGGMTPNFEWPIPRAERVGNCVVAMPTTVNEEDSVVYLDDFAMATGEAALPASP